MVNIRSVTPEIILTWTNFVRTNVAWTNVNLIVEIWSVTAEILLTLSLCGWWVVGGGGVKSFSCRLG